MGQIFEIKYLNNLIFDYLTIGEQKFIQRKRCSKTQLLETVKNCLSSNLYTMAYDIFIFNNGYRHNDHYCVKNQINSFVLQECNKDQYYKGHLLWLYEKGLLEHNEYYELVEGKISFEQMNDSKYIPYLWILFISNTPDQNKIFPYINAKTVVQAGLHGHYAIVKLLVENCLTDTDIKETSRIYDYMTTNSNDHEYKFNWEILKYLIDRGMPVDDCVLLCIAQYGDVHMFKYLETKNLLHFEYGWYIENAALQGNINMVKYLLEHKIRISSCAMNNAAEKNHFDLVKYIIEETDFGKKDITEYSITPKIIQTGNIDMIEYLFQKIGGLGNSYMGELFGAATEINDFKLVKYLYNKCSRGNVKLTIILSYKILYSCNTEMLNYIKSNFDIYFKLNDNVLNCALGDNNYGILAFLFEVNKINSDDLHHAFYDAINKNNNIMFEFLLQKCGGNDFYLDRLDCNIVNVAFRTYNEVIINWVLKHDHPKICNRCLIRTIKYGKNEIFKDIFKERQKRKIYIDRDVLLEQTKIYNRPQISKFIKLNPT